MVCWTRSTLSLKTPSTRSFRTNLQIKMTKACLEAPMTKITSSETLLVEAADHTFKALQYYLREPENEEVKQALLRTCTHYTNCGVQVNLKKNAMIVKRMKMLL